jgi:shikimate dehydrogenase
VSDASPDEARATGALRFALLGDPVAHSKSPAMHAAAYRALGMPHTYEAIRVSAGALGAEVLRLRSGEIAGFNVTVPHKRAILAHVDVVAPSARACGAANTLLRAPDASIHAHNTDVPALAEELARLLPDRAGAWDSACAIVLGSGGAARSAVAALALHLGVRRVVVRARAFADRAAGERFVGELLPLLGDAAKRTEIRAEGFLPAPDVERDTHVVVQATSAGMSSASPGEAAAEAVAWSDLPPRAVALDVVYAPADTPFLRAAEAHGLRSANGIGMLARQGALAFELWLGVPAPYNAMLAALL